MNKGIILAGGNGTRLRPLTQITNKHLLPIFNKPMILYPLDTLKALGIEDILIVSGGEHIGRFTEFLGDGKDFGVNLTYRVQRAAGGIAEALGLARDFASGQPVSVILGDNIFDNTQLNGILDILNPEAACVFLKEVEDPQRFGVPVFQEEIIVRIVEKPKNPSSNYAVTGLYCYPNEVFEAVEYLHPSERGELEITDVNNYFIEKENMRFHILDGYWSDAGTFESLLSSSNWASQQIE